MTDPSGATRGAAVTSSPVSFGDTDLGQTVTLITGDRVTLLPRPGPAVHVEPGPGRAQLGFITLERGDEVTVIPKDVALAVASQRVDRALFDITRLIAEGYSDRDRADLPLIAAGLPPGTVEVARAASGDLTIDREIPALSAIAVRQRKSSPGAALALVRASAGPAQPGAGAPRLWLDRRFRLAIDRAAPGLNPGALASVRPATPGAGAPARRRDPHGAPGVAAAAAQPRAATGAGVVITVLDTGIDASHPDLAGKVVDAATFVDDGAGTSDIAGWGTLIGSIIAGTGAASGGQFRGVAPDARLLSARVCEDIGFGILDCSDSAIIAGMAWAAAEKRAPIVNYILSRRVARPGPDPIEDAVNQLSARYGTLFVMAAGDNGPGDRTIFSENTAEAALTVGAVDGGNDLAAFSGRGPGFANDALKPEITAPGIDIVGARSASHEAFREAVGTAYQRLSSTAVAAAQVSGAAALLLEQHPDWTGAQLKAALIGAAEPNTALTAFQQGGGRLDIDRAARQRVTAQPGTLGLGVARWPHADDPIVTRTVTYRNEGPDPIILMLTANLTLADHRAAPADMIRVAPAALLVPAGGSADAVVTVDTRGDAPDGRYTGAVVATAGDLRVGIPVAIERESEAYDLKLQTARLPAGVLLLARHPDSEGRFFVVDGETTMRLPPDTYGLYATLEKPVYFVYPNLVLDHDTTVMLDGRLASSVDVAVPGVPLAFGAIETTSWDIPANFKLVTFGYTQLATAHLGPDLPEAEFRSWIGLTAKLRNTEPSATDQYTLFRQERGHQITGWHETIAPERFATIEADHTGEAHSMFRRTPVPYFANELELGPVSVLDFVDDYPANAHRVEHTFGDGILWATTLDQTELPRTIYGFRSVVGGLTGFWDYQPGQRYRERWYGAPFAPAFARQDTGQAPASRLGDALTFVPTMFSDSASPARWSWAAGLTYRYTLLRDGVPLVDDRFAQFHHPPVVVPPEAATYRLEREQTRVPEVFELSPHVTAAWTFRSEHVDGVTPVILPLPTVRFFPELDAQNRAPSGEIELPAAVERPIGAALPPIEDVSVEISFDDGATWSSVPGALRGDRWSGRVVHPPGAAYASLRGTARDADGNTNEVTIIRAYHVAASAP